MLAPWKETYDKPRQGIKKQRQHFADKCPLLVKAIVFPVVMYRCESWTIKKTESKEWMLLICVSGVQTSQF